MNLSSTEPVAVQGAAVALVNSVIALLVLTGAFSSDVGAAVTLIAGNVGGARRRALRPRQGARPWRTGPHRSPAGGVMGRNVVDFMTSAERRGMHRGERRPDPLHRARPAGGMVVRRHASSPATSHRA